MKCQNHHESLLAMSHTYSNVFQPQTKCHSPVCLNPKPSLIHRSVDPYINEIVWKTVHMI